VFLGAKRVAPQRPWFCRAARPGGTKTEKILSLLRQPSGATLAALMTAPQWQDDFVGLVMSSLEHRGDAFFGGHDDGKLVRPETVIKYFWILSVVSGPIRRFFSRWTTPVFFSSSFSGFVK
jgi:hypothetical protein